MIFQRIIPALASALCMLATAPLQAAEGHAHEPRHGGILVAGKAGDFELVARADALHLYVSDHGKPVDLSRATARVTLLAAGGHKQDVDLVPGPGRLEATGSFPVAAGTQAVAVVRVGGTVLGTARFRLK